MYPDKVEPSGPLAPVGYDWDDYASAYRGGSSSASGWDIQGQ